MASFHLPFCLLFLSFFLVMVLASIEGMDDMIWAADCLIDR